MTAALSATARRTLIRRAHRDDRPLPLWLSTDETARLLHTSTDKVTAACRAGRLPAIRIRPGAPWRIRADRLLAARP